MNTKAEQYTKPKDQPKLGRIDKLLNEAFSVFWDRINTNQYGPLTRFAYEKNAIEYFIAIDQKIGRSNSQPLVELMLGQIDPPPEFLPILGFLIRGDANKGGRKSTFTFGEKLNVYATMCEMYFLENKELPVIYKEIENRLMDTETSVDIKTIRAIWNEFLEEENVKNHFKSRRN
jgi:hypothetical protein